MMESKELNELVESYKELSYDQKKQYAVKEIKKLYGLMSLTQSKTNIPENLLFNREIFDVNNTEINDEDFVEAVFAYTKIFQEVFSEYVNKIVEGKE